MLEAYKWNVHTTFLYQNNKIKFRITYSFVFQLRWLFTDYLTFCLRLARSFIFKRLENMYTEKFDYFLTNVDEYFRKNNHPFQQFSTNKYYHKAQTTGNIYFYNRQLVHLVVQ